jgi:ABC-2 type transport system ATP-binding protein
MIDATALAVAGLSHSFGKAKVLDSVSFVLNPGDFTVLLGLNGAGKTTLFALITRLYHSSTGSIAVFGSDVRQRASAALARMGVVFQQPTLDLDLTVEQNLCYHASLHGSSRVANAAGSSWRGRCCMNRLCCCSTSRPSGSTSRAGIS